MYLHLHTALSARKGISIYILLFPEGQTGEASEPSKKQGSFSNRAALAREVLLFFDPKVRSLNL
jgi:hypothetical protein